MKGTVKFYNESKGFGFITADDGKEYFVHLTGLKEGVNIKDNDAVSFETEIGDRGPKAVNVELDSEDSAATEAPVEAPAEESEDFADEE